MGESPHHALGEDISASVHYLFQTDVHSHQINCGGHLPAYVHTTLQVNTILLCQSCSYIFFWINLPLTLTSKVGEKKKFLDVPNGTGHKSLRLKLRVVRLWNQFVHQLCSTEFTCKKCVTKLNKLVELRQYEYCMEAY